MKPNHVEDLLALAARSSELPGWNDPLQQLVDTTLSRYQEGIRLSDDALSWAAADAGICDEGKQKAAIC